MSYSPQLAVRIKIGKDLLHHRTRSSIAVAVCWPLLVTISQFLVSEFETDLGGVLLRHQRFLRGGFHLVVGTFQKEGGVKNLQRFWSFFGGHLPAVHRLQDPASWDWK